MILKITSNMERRTKKDNYSNSEIKQVIVIRKDLKMGTGKIAAQASHASLASYLETLKTHPDLVKAWASEGQTKVVLKIKSQEEAEELKKKLKVANIPFKAIRDAGQTQVPPGTETAIGIGPYYIKDIDKITGELGLL